MNQEFFQGLKLSKEEIKWWCARQNTKYIVRVVSRFGTKFIDDANKELRNILIYPLHLIRSTLRYDGGYS